MFATILLILYTFPLNVRTCTVYLLIIIIPLVYSEDKVKEIFS